MGLRATRRMDESNTGNSAFRAWNGIVVAAASLAVPGLGGAAWMIRDWLARLPPDATRAAPPHLAVIVALAEAAVALGLVTLAATAMRLSRKARAAQSALQAEIQRRQDAETALHQAQKMEAVGRLAGGIAHDFNNHLTAISSNVELLKRRLPARTPALDRFADAAMQGVQRAAALSQRLLAFSRQQTPDPEPLDAGQVVAGMLDLLRRTLGEKIEIEATSGNRLWLTRTDANQLESALLALAVNARDAMPTGGRLRIESANIALDDDAAACCADLAPGQYVAIAVSDTGFGTAAAAATNPLFSRHGYEAGAAGLGLAMVRNFARLSGGHVQVETMPGRGRTVRLYLPRYAVPGLPADGIGDALHRASCEVVTVLVVEDDDAVRIASAEALREIGYDVLEAPDAMEAVRLLADRGGIDLLFTDVGLPGGVNGRALADAARNIHPALKVLFTTGYTRDAAQRGGAPWAEEHFLPKPFSLEDLAAKVRGVLGPTIAADALGADAFGAGTETAA